MNGLGGNGESRCREVEWWGEIGEWMLEGVVWDVALVGVCELFLFVCDGGKIGSGCVCVMGVCVCVCEVVGCVCVCVCVGWMCVCVCV